MKMITNSSKTNNYDIQQLMDDTKRQRGKKQGKVINNAIVGKEKSALPMSPRPYHNESKSKLKGSRQSDLKQFRKAVKSKGQQPIVFTNISIEEHIKKELILVAEKLQQYSISFTKNKSLRPVHQSDKDELFQLQDTIRHKDQVIKQLTLEIDNLKKMDRIISEEENESTNKQTADNSQKEKIFKLAQQLRNDREDLGRLHSQHEQKIKSFLKIKKLIEGIQATYGKGRENDSGKLISYEQFKQRMRDKKRQQVKVVKRIDFYHMNPSDKQNTKSMKDLIVRKNITLAALKNSRKKYAVEMNELFAKIQFLKDQDLLLNQKIRQKQDELINMQKKFSETKRQRVERISLPRYRQ